MKKFFKINKKISYIYTNNKFLILVDEENRFFYFDESFKFIKGIKFNLPSNKSDENGVKISTDAKYALIAIKNVLTLWDLESKKHLASFLHKKDILSVAISKDNKYFASGDIEGKVFVYNLNLKKKTYELKKHRDFITDLSFYEDRSHLVAGGYDKCVIFYNLHTFDKKDKYYHLKPVKKIKLDKYLISVDEIGTIINWDKLKKEFKDISKFYNNFRDFALFREYIIIASDKNVIIYNLKDLVIENDNFLEFENIDKIAIFKEFLIISNKSGEIYFRSLFEEEKLFLDLIIKEDFKSAFELIDKNPFLKFSKGYERLNKIIELYINKAKDLFLTNEAKALEILDKFLLIPQLREKIQKTINHFKNYKKFVFAIKKENFALAYFLANRYEMLKETKYYRLLEKRWEIAFEKAKEYALKGDNLDVKEILEPFMIVKEKIPLIELLLNEPDVFKSLKEKLSERDFKGFFEIIKKYPELKNTAEYKKVINYANELYKFANKFISEEEFEKAKKAALIFKNIEGFEDKAEKLLEEIKIGLKFLGYIQKKEYQKAFELTERYAFLKNLKSYKDLIKKHNDVYEKAEKLIANGKTEKAKELLQNEGVLKRISL